MNKNITAGEIAKTGEKLCNRILHGDYEDGVSKSFIKLHRTGDGRPQPLEHPFSDDMIPILYKTAPRKYTNNTLGFFKYPRSPTCDFKPTITMHCSDLTVLFHEIMHFADYKLGDRVRCRELIAEFGAAVLCEITNTEYDFSPMVRYLTYYNSNKGGHKLAAKLMKMLDRVVKCIQYLAQFVVEKTEYVWNNGTHCILVSDDVGAWDKVQDGDTTIQLRKFMGRDAATNKCMYSYVR